MRIGNFSMTSLCLITKTLIIKIINKGVSVCEKAGPVCILSCLFCLSPWVTISNQWL